MSLLPYLEFAPELGERIFIAEGAKVIGRVTLNDDVSVWFNTVIRADVNEIKIGKNTNVQDMCMFHVTEDNGVTIGENTSFGHNVVLHGCKVGNGCLIGMGSIILDGAEIGDNSLVAAGSLITPGKKFPPGSFIKGRPAKADRELTEEEMHSVSHHFESYIKYKDQYLGMEISDTEEGLLADLKVFLKRMGRHNLFLLSSSLAYYAALALAPLLLIVLAIATIIAEDVQLKIIRQVSFFAPEAANMLQMVFKNLQSRVDLGSISGVFGLVFLLFLASFVFMQMRYSLDVIYGTYEQLKPKTMLQVFKEKMGLMLVVIVMCALFGISLLINPLFNYLFSSNFESDLWGKFIQVLISFSILFILFTGLYFFTPTKKKIFKDCAQMSFVTTCAFLVGNTLTSFYMKRVALDSLYGAAGALLIFLLWSFYSSLIILLSVELFEFLKRKQSPLILK